IDPTSDPLYADKLQPQGQSLQAVWTGQQAKSGRELIVAELFGNHAVRRGKWKLSYIARPPGNGNWELFDMENDPGETQDLAEQHPKVLKELLAEYETYKKEKGVIHPEPPPSPSLRQLYAKPCGWWCEFKFWAISMLPAP
ncbi:MAG: hypothetical protein AAF512_20790, partial [Pseudomonadota bacterium]